MFNAHSYRIKTWVSNGGPDKWSNAWKDIGQMDWENMLTVRNGTWDAQANWKLLIENFLEWYHLPSIHPTLTTVSGPNDHVYGDTDEWTIGFKTEPLTDAGTVADPSFKPHIPGAHPKTGWFHYLFPNMFWFVFPTHAFVLTMNPITPTRTVENATLLVHPHSKWSEEELNELWSFYETVNTEDVDICERVVRVQRGILSEAFQQGWIEPKTEKNIITFHNQLKYHF